MATGIIDVLWSVASYERLVTDGRLSPEEAITAVAWVLSLLEDAMRSGRGPSRAGARPRTHR